MQRMTSHELEIAQIHDLRLIHFYNMFRVCGDHYNRQEFIPAMIVMYDKTKLLNYCQLDPEFTGYLKKIFDQYHIEKDQRSIDMDEKTRYIMEHGALSLEAPMASFYMGKKSYFDTIIPYSERQIRAVLPILSYHLHQIYSFSNQAVTVEKIQGWRENMALQVNWNDEEEIIPMCFEKENDFHYRFLVGSLNPIALDLYFKPEGISCFWQYQSGTLSGSFEYRKEADVMVSRVSVSGAEQLQYLHHDLIEKTDHPLLPFLEMDTMPNLREAYPLPWGGYYLYEENATDIVDGYRQKTVTSVYGMVEADCVILKQYNEKKVSKSGSDLIMKTDGMMKNIALYRVGNQYSVCETSFADLAMALGDYKRQLAGKTFYHVASAPVTFDKIDHLSLLPVASEDEITAGYQLLQTTNIQKVMKRGMR